MLLNDNFVEIIANTILHARKLACEKNLLSDQKANDRKGIYATLLRNQLTNYKHQSDRLSETSIIVNALCKSESWEDIGIPNRFMGKDFFNLATLGLNRANEQSNYYSSLVNMHAFVENADRIVNVASNINVKAEIVLQNLAVIAKSL